MPKTESAAAAAIYHLFVAAPDGSGLRRLDEVAIQDNPHEKPLPRPAAWHTRNPANVFARRVAVEDSVKVMVLKCWATARCGVCAAHRNYHGCG